MALLLVSVGFMSSEYIKEKEFVEFTKRYAERGILIIPILFAPCDFNRWDDLRKLQFFKPKGSEFGKADIKDFTFSDLIKFKDTDGLSIYNPNIDRYVISLVALIEKSFSGFFNEKIEPKISHLPSRKALNNKLSDYPLPSSLFTGRINEIELLKNSIIYSRIIAIEGLGG